jgi:hypothetical protein
MPLVFNETLIALIVASILARRYARWFFAVGAHVLRGRYVCDGEDRGPYESLYRHMVAGSSPADWTTVRDLLTCVGPSIAI